MSYWFIKLNFYGGDVISFTLRQMRFSLLIYVRTRKFSRAPCAAVTKGASGIWIPAAELQLLTNEETAVTQRSAVIPDSAL